MLQEDVHVERTGEILRAGVREASGSVYIINPTQATMRELVSECQQFESPPAIHLFADEGSLKELTDDFLVASALADLVDDGTLSVRSLQSVPRSSLLATEEFLVSLVVGENEVAGLTTTDDSFVSSTYAHYEKRWKRAEEFSLRTPPLSRIRESLATEISESAVEDFDTILEALDTARGNGEGLDEVTIALLVAANNGELLYDISRWGEDIRLASKATFSRSKNRLEDIGLIETEKVPIDVGRPRLRLMLPSNELRDASIETVTERAQAELE